MAHISLIETLDAALILAKKAGSEITVVHVLERISTAYIESQNTLKMDTGEGQSILDRCSEFAKQKGISINTVFTSRQYFFHNFGFCR